MAEKVVAVDDAGNEIPEGEAKPVKKTKLELAKERLEAEQKKQKAAEEKKAEKEKSIATKRSDGLKERMKEVEGAKESEIAQAVSDGQKKTFVSLTIEEAKKAAEHIKELKKNQQRAEKASEKLVKLAQDAGLTEKEVAGDYSNQRTTKFVELSEEEVTAAVDGLKQKAKDKKKEEALALRTTLTDEERAELNKQEKTVIKFLPTFQTAAMQIGGALTVINQKRLYRQSHPTFEAYVAERFDLSRPHAYSVMAASQAFNWLVEGDIVDSKNLPSITAAEAITRGVRGLLKEGNFGDNPEIDQISAALARNAYDLARQTAPKDADGNPNITPAHLASTFSVLNEIAKTGNVTVDGKAVPLNLAAASVDEMITTESAERVARMKQSLQDRMNAITAHNLEARKAAAGSTNGAIASATGNNAPIPKGVVPKIFASCSVHGRVEIKDTTDTDITLGCECTFINSTTGFVFEKNPKFPEAVAAGNAA